MSSLAHGDTSGDEKLYFYSFCFVSITVYCCITVKLLVNAVEKRIGGSCCLTSFFWWFQMWCEIEWGMLMKDSWPIHTGLPVVSNLSKRRVIRRIFDFIEKDTCKTLRKPCVCVLNGSVIYDSLWSHELPPGSSVHGILQQEYWSELPVPTPGDLPDPGSNPHLLHCRGILYHWAT